MSIFVASVNAGFDRFIVDKGKRQIESRSMFFDLLLSRGIHTASFELEPAQKERERESSQQFSFS